MMHSSGAGVVKSGLHWVAVFAVLCVIIHITAAPQLSHKLETSSLISARSGYCKTHSWQASGQLLTNIIVRLKYI